MKNGGQYASRLYLERLNSPADAATWRAAWLAGELLILHRSVFASSKQDEIIPHNLRQLVEREAPRFRNGRRQQMS